MGAVAGAGDTGAGSRPVNELQGPWNPELRVEIRHTFLPCPCLCLCLALFSQLSAAVLMMAEVMHTVAPNRNTFKDGVSEEV